VASEALIQSDHPNIVTKAREIVGDATDAVERVRRIMAWIAQNMEQVNVVGVPSALETLQTLRGDCNEHTTLFTALARAVGLPTRVDVGMVHQEGRFFYHAWAEVLLGDAWVTVDPTWGQFPADVTHLRFVRGSLREQLAMFNVIGRIKEVTLVEAVQ
jgi:transglutaminase-like putative cysteine protease